MSRGQTSVVVAATLIAFVIGLIVAPDLHEAVRALWR
jgi:hypothetical protein